MRVKGRGWRGVRRPGRRYLARCRRLVHPCARWRQLKVSGLFVCARALARVGWGWGWVRARVCERKEKCGSLFQPPWCAGARACILLLLFRADVREDGHKPFSWRVEGRRTAWCCLSTHSTGPLDAGWRMGSLLYQLLCMYQLLCTLTRFVRFRTRGAEWHST